MGRVHLTHLGGLDGLRGLAALAVFGVHVNQTVRAGAQPFPISVERVLENGDHGVSLFFCLSGFLLAIPFWRALVDATKLPSFRSYAARRAARILPAYYAALTILIVAGGLWRAPEALPDVLLHYAFLFNYAEFSILSINPVFWTLAVEVQFYVLLPLLFLALRRIPPAAAFAWVMVIAITAYALSRGIVSAVERPVPWPWDPRLTWVRPHGAVLDYSLLAHLPHFLIGAAAGALFLEDERILPALSSWIARHAEPLFWISLALACVLLATGFEDRLTVPHGRYGLPVVPVLLATMILTAPRAAFASRCLESPPLRLLGLISYGVYIYHVPCQTLTDRLMLRHGLDATEHWATFATASLAVTILVATLSWVVVERPFLGMVRERR